MNLIVCESLKKNYNIELSQRTLQRYRRADEKGTVPSFELAKSIFNILRINEYSDEDIIQILKTSREYKTQQKHRNSNFRFDLDVPVTKFYIGNYNFSENDYSMFVDIIKEQIKDIYGEKGTISEYIVGLINNDLNRTHN